MCLTYVPKVYVTEVIIASEFWLICMKISNPQGFHHIGK